MHDKHEKQKFFWKDIKAEINPTPTPAEKIKTLIMDNINEGKHLSVYPLAFLLLLSPFFWRQGWAVVESDI